MALGPEDECDSGMASLQENSKDVTPEKPRSAIGNGDSDGDGFEDFEPETFTERLLGLTEMFPENVRTICYKVTTGTKTGIISLYGLSRSAMWIFITSSLILFAPPLFEIERAQLEEAQRAQKKQVLLGPNAAMSGGSFTSGMPMMPPR